MGNSLKNTFPLGSVLAEKEPDLLVAVLGIHNFVQMQQMPKIILKVPLNMQKTRKRSRNWDKVKKKENQDCNYNSAIKKGPFEGGLVPHT